MGQSVDSLNNSRREYLHEYQRFLQTSSNAKIGFEKLLAPQNGGVKTDVVASEERDSSRETQPAGSWPAGGQLVCRRAVGRRAAG